MLYTQILLGKFISRPNRFIAYVEIDGKTEVCHVKNTGRCRELLVSGADVFVQKSNNPQRKTKYDLISVYKGNMLVNMDSQAPNKVFGEWAAKGLYFKNPTLIKPECKYKNSRFDFYIEADGRRSFVEVKGVTLENEGVVSFPDAPTERGIKHLNELCDAVSEGYDAYIFFVIQMEKCLYFTPSYINHPEFAHALSRAGEKGVRILALNSIVTPTELTLNEFIEVRI